MKSNAWDSFKNEYNTPEVPQSRYNSALLKLGRMNESWMTCRRHWRVGDYVSLYDELRLIWKELVADATKDQKEEFKKYVNNYKNKLKEKNFLTLKQEIFEILSELWDFLTVVEKEQGLGKSYINPEEDKWFK